MITTIFWDNDGVLVDTERLYFQATQEAMASVGVTLDEAKYVEFFLARSSGVWHLAAEHGVSESELERLRHKRGVRYTELLRLETEAMAGAEAALERLAPHTTMGVVTTSHREHFDIIHRQTGFMRYFDFVLSREDYKHSKPDPEPYLRALELTGSQRENCVVIEDSPRGLIAAKAAGLRCWVIPTALSQLGDFTLADQVFADISQVASTLAAQWE